MDLSEYLEQTEESWFLTGKIEYSIQAMMVSKTTFFRNELEIADYVVEDDGETVILKGILGEMWASKLRDVKSAYTAVDGSELDNTVFSKKDSWVTIKSISKPNSYYAMFVPVDISVTVKTAWGDILHTNMPESQHSNGDYLVCRIGVDGEPDISDVWILNGLLFSEYYDTANITSVFEDKAA